MDIKNKLYPYPVIWENNDDYETSTFDCELKNHRGIRQFLIEMKFKLNNEEILKMIEDGLAEYVLHIECSRTSFRRIVSTKDSSSSVVIKDELINDKVCFCPFVVMKEDVYGYTNSDWNEDYKGNTFNFKRGNIIAIGTQKNFNIEKEDMDLRNLPSIFDVFKRETVEEGPIEIDIYSDKIQIKLNIMDYDRYASMVKFGDRNSIDIVNSCLILPTLVSVIYELKGSFEELSEYRWFRAIKKMMEKYNGVFDEEYVENVNAFELAQRIMSNPISSALLGLEEILGNNNEED